MVQHEIKWLQRVFIYCSNENLSKNYVSKPNIPQKSCFICNFCDYEAISVFWQFYIFGYNMRLKMFLLPIKWKFRLYLSTIPTYISHFNSHLNYHFLFSRSGNSSKKNSHFWKKNSHFYLIRSGNLSGN